MSSGPLVLLKIVYVKCIMRIRATVVESRLQSDACDAAPGFRCPCVADHELQAGAPFLTFG